MDEMGTKRKPGEEQGGDLPENGGIVIILWVSA
jgi:hypothetical protein